jgi:hypothetical protein
MYSIRLNVRGKVETHTESNMGKAIARFLVLSQNPRLINDVVLGLAESDRYTAYVIDQHCRDTPLNMPMPKAGWVTIERLEASELDKVAQLTDEFLDTVPTLGRAPAKYQGRNYARRTTPIDTERVGIITH